MKIRCLIADDEPIARKGLEEYVRDVEFLELSAVCENALKANEVLSHTTIDLMLLDIQMPKLSGIDFLRSLTNPPAVIFTTAFHEYALEGYELDIIDYLVKPIAFSRFLKAVNKAKEFIELKQKPVVNDAAAYFFLKVDSKFEKIFYHEVLYIEALQNYVAVHTKDKKMLSYITFTSMEKQLPADLFIKVHKSYLVAVSKINSVEGNLLIIGNHEIPVSRALKDEVMKKVVENRLLKR